MNTLQIDTQAGYQLGALEFPGERSQMVLISPATGVKQRYYLKFAQYLQSEGYSTFTFDFGGIGTSKQESLKTFDTSAFQWGANDLEAMIQHCRKKHPSKSLTVIGHSIGGQLIDLAPSACYISKVLLVASQSGYYGHWKGIEQLKMRLNWFLVFPVLTGLFGYFPGKKLGVMEDLPKSMATEWRTWCTSPNYLFDFISPEKLHFDKVTAPLYNYSATDDNYAPKKAVDWLSNKYDQATTTRRHLQPKELRLSKIGHFGFFKDSMKTTFWQLILDDLKA